MSETAQGILASIAWLTVGGFATLYWVGGRAGTPKWIRRIAGGLLVAGVTVIIAAVKHTLVPLMLPILVSLPAALSMGYGGDTTFEKILRRGLFGLCVSANILWVALPLGHLDIAIYQIILGTSASIFFGVRNPFNDASKEEAVIGGLCILLIPFTV
jgi:hypothetical protein